MNAPGVLADVHYELESAAFPGVHLVVSELRIIEALDEPYTLELVVVMPETQTEVPEMARLLGRDCTLRIDRRGRQRVLHGIVREVQEGDDDLHGAWARIVASPALWMLGLSRDTRIFQNMSVVEILGSVLGLHLATFGRAMLFVPSRPYPRREYCVQYQESHLDFVQRLMQEEGIGYSFDHSMDRELLVLHDSNRPFLPVESSLSSGFVPYEPHNLEVSATEPVVFFQLAHRETINAVVVRDVDWTRRSPTLEAAADASGALEAAAAAFDALPGRRESYEHGLARSTCISDYAEAQARYLADDGAVQSALRRQGYEEASLVGVGRGRVTTFAPGRRFVLGGHPTMGLDGEYVLTRVEHTTRRDAGPESDPYANRFECIPYDRDHRPLRRTPKPQVASMQTATVVGPPGEEIHTDVHGRIKVRFHWDRQHPHDDSASCWVRVQQTWAGPSWGSMFIPRVGMEVVVTFIDGDPDRPLVTGCVYNGTNSPPYPLPDEKTKSTIKSRTSPGGAGYNELRFEDRAGAEEIWLHGQKDWNTQIENDVNQGVGRDRARSVTRDETVTVGRNWSQDVAVNRRRSVGQDEVIAVGGSQRQSIAREQRVRVGGSRDVAVTGSERASYGRDLVIGVQGSLVAEVGGTEWRKVQRLVVEAEGEILLKCGDNFISIGPDRVVIEGYESLINCGEAPGDAARPEVEGPADDEDQSG